MVPFALPWPSVLMLPRSPTWRSESEGEPWPLPKGLTMIVPNVSIHAGVSESRGFFWGLMDGSLVQHLNEKRSAESRIDGGTV